MNVLYFFNKDFNVTAQLFCVEKTYFNKPKLYRKRDSNSQKTDSKSAAYAIPPFLLLVEAVGFEPTQQSCTCFTDKPNSPTLMYFQYFV